MSLARIGTFKFQDTIPNNDMKGLAVLEIKAKQ